MPINFSLESPVEPEQASVPNAMLNEQHGFEPEQIALTKAPVQEQYDFEPAAEPVVYQNPPQLPYVPNTVCPSRPFSKQNPNIFNQHYNNSSQYQPQLHHQHPSRSNRQDQWQARPWELSNQVVTTMAPAVPRKNPRRGGITTQPVAAPTSVPAPKVRRSNTNDPHGLDPNGIAIYGQSPPSHRPLHGFLTDSHHPLLDSGGANNNTNSQEGLIKSPRSAQPDNDNIVRDLQVQLRKEQIRNHRMTQVQNKVQSVLTQNHELHENSAPRLFLVLPTMSSEPEGQETAALAKRTSTLSTSSSYPSTSTIASGNGPRTFRVHFLCECGQYTRPLQSSGLNHIHFVDHEGYELVRSKEFFDKYGEFIRTLSHLIRNGVNCGMVSINALLANNMAVQPQLQPHPRNANNFYRAYAVGQEQQKNRNLDARLAEMIDYLDSLENDLDLETLENKLNSGVDFLDGTDIQQLLTYIRLPPHEISSIGGLYRIMTSRGFAKWVCEEHHRSTIHQQNELDFQREIRDLGGQYDVKTGRARIRLSSDKDAGQLYKIMTKAHNLHELDIALKWSFNESDIQRFVQAITESKIGVLSLDGCQLKGKTTLSSSEGFLKSKKYDPLYKILFSSKIQSLRLVNLPSLLPNISVNHPIAGASTFSVRILQLENVGALDFSGERGGHTSLGVNLSLRNGNSHVHSQSIMRTLLTSFRYLTSIIVPGMNIGDEGVRMITEQQDLHKTLRWINFSDNGISSIGGQLLATCLAREKAIVFLDMGINAIGDDILVMIIEAMGSKLMSLNLESTGFGDKATKALERLVISYFACPDPEPRLKYLNLANSGWTTSALQSLGRTLVRLRLFTPTIVQSSGSRKSDLEMGPGEAFLLVNSMIKTTHINGFSGKEKLWHQRHMILSQYAALTATKESYGPPDLRAQDMIAVNSRIKILRLWNAGLSNGAARYLIGLLDMNILTKLDLRRCVRIFKPPEVVAILTRMLIHTTDDDPQILQAAAAAAKATAQTRPQAPAALSSGLPKNCLRSLLLSSTGVDDQVAEVLAQHLQSGGSSIEKLDVSSNNLTHKGITSLLNALCNNTSIRRLNLGQNFRASHSIDPSSTTASSQMTREALRRMMLENTTLETLYFISADIDIVAKGLNANKTIRSLAFDRLEGTLKGVEAFGRALAVNQTLLRLKVYDGRQPPFLQGFYNCGGSGHYSNSHPQQQHIQYMDPFREFKHEAIKTVEGGLKFNYSLIEVQWPELFDIAQPWTDRLDAILLRNIDILKSEEAETGSDGHTKDGSDSQRLHGGSRTHPGVSSLSRRFSFTSTTCTLLNAPDRSSSSSQSMDPDFGPPMSNHSNNSSIGFIPVSGGGGGGEGYTYSVHSKHSNGGAPPTLDSTAGSSGGGLGRGHVSGLASVDFSDQTANRRRQFPSREQQRQQYQQQQQRKVRMSRHSHVDEPHIFQRMNRHGYIRHGYVGPEPATAAAVTVMFPEETAPRSPKGVPATTPGDIVGCDSQMTTESPSLAGQNDDTSTAVPEPIEPAVSNGSSWFHLATDTGNAAAGALTLVDGVWKRTVQLLTTRRAHVDAVCPIAKTSYVYCDNEVYDAVLTERSTGVTYVIQLLYSSEEHVYYIYVRWGETDFRLEGPHTTIKAAKEAFQVTYSDLFGVQWTERETDVNDAWLYEVKTHETLGETEEIEEVFDETEVSADIALQTEVEQKKEAEVETSTSTTATEEVVVDEENTKEVATTHETELDARTAMSNGTTLQLLEYKISGLPASLGDLTMEGLKSEMKTAPVFDDQMFGALDLEEEPDILVFLVDRVFEDPNYTKLLVWTVYKSGAEGAVSQSTKNAKCILEMAGIQFQPSIQVKVVASPNAVG
ncbi:hypothetical protein BGZ83_000678 [Gryganskiella cystojenkinii]|nr:hypothetical protein BGZ83_000678 [Gryganskiella cystojenkinii]